MPRYISHIKPVILPRQKANLAPFYLNQKTVMTTSKLNSLLGLIERLPKHVFY